jgi:hypothetical protein
MMAICLVGWQAGSSGAAIASSRFEPASGFWEVQLLPPLNFAEAGWCMGDGREGGGGFSCDAPMTEAAPILIEDWSRSSPPPVTRGYALTLPRVRAVSINGEAPIPTRTQPGLPDGLRAVAVERPGELFSSRLVGLPYVVALDEHGNPLRELRQPPLRRQDRDVRFWRATQNRRRGVCGINVQGVPGLVEHHGSVLSRLTPTTGIVDRGLLVCASTYYEKGTWPLTVSVLLDAPKPGVVAPVPIPGMKPLRGRRRDLAEIVPLLKLLARRHGKAWVLIEGGATLSDRLAVLTHLQITLPKA